MSNLSERNADILSRFSAGETLQAIGERYGLTRERVRQIIAKAGAKPRRQEHAEFMADLVADAKLRNMTRRQAVQMYGASRANKLANQHGIQWAPKQYDPAVIAAAFEVAEGASISAACGGNRALVARVARYCEKHGIVSRHGRWLDRSNRAATVKEMRARGASWSTLAVKIAELEGKPIGKVALLAWCQRHMPPADYAKVTARKQRVASGAIPTWAPKKLAPSQYPKRTKGQKPKVIYHPDIKKAAELNYGKAPASIIAAVHGVSRNVIIGHWFRLRRAGVLA